jgi:hypothetical protein
MLEAHLRCMIADKAGELTRVKCALELANMYIASRFQPDCLPQGLGGRPTVYQDSSFLFKAEVQTAWRKSYKKFVDSSTLVVALLLGESSCGLSR